MNISGWDWWAIIQGALGGGLMSLGLIPLLMKTVLDKWVSASFEKKKIKWNEESNSRLKLLESDLEGKLKVATIKLEAKNTFEMKNLQASLDYEVQRSLHFAAQEYKVIPEAWRMTIDAVRSFDQVINCANPGIDFESAENSQIKEYLEKYDFIKDWHINMMIASRPDRREDTWNQIAHSELKEIIVAKHLSVKSYIDLNSIFMEEALINDFVVVLDALWSAVRKWDVSRYKAKYFINSQDSRMGDLLKYWDELDQKQRKLEKVIRDCLRERAGKKLNTTSSAEE